MPALEVSPPPNRDFAAAVEAIYAAAAVPTLWVNALRAIADCFGDIGANLIYKRDDGSVGLIVTPNMQAAHDDYAAGWWKQDIRWARVTEYVYRHHGGAVTDRHFMTDEEMETHPFYTVFERKWGLRWVASMEVSPDPHIVVALSVHRGPDKPAYSDEELAQFTRLGRNVEAALRLSIRLIQAEVTSLGLGDALSRLSIGVFVLDSLGRIVFSNSAAQRAIGHSLVLVGKRLAAQGAKERHALEDAIAHAVGDLAEQRAEDLRPILLRRRGSDRPVTVYVLPVRAPLGPAIDQMLNRARAVVLVVDSAADAPPDPALVRDVLGLTLGEARVASLVGSGITPQEAADKLGISKETVRSALKRVFAKVGVSRQSELAALLTRLVLR
jgi:DNA-binding CsgD family transcriptional regulator